MKYGRYMEMRGLTREQALNALKALKSQGTGFIADNHRDAARKIVGQDTAMASIKPGQFLAPRNANVRGISKAQCERVAASLNARAKNAAPVEVVQSFGELPEHLRKKFAGKESSLEGVYDPKTGKVWLVAENLESATRASEVWCHEQLVHHGLRGLFTEQERKVLLNQLWLLMGGMGNSLIRRISQAYGIDPRSDERGRLLVMEETVAKLAEKSQAGLLTEQQESMWRKICRAIANAIGRIVERLTGRKSAIGMEQVNNLLSALGRYVMDGEQARAEAGVYADGAMASAQERNGQTNSYGVPMERVTEIDRPFTREEANEALQKLAGQDLPNILEDLTAQVNRKQREKMVSGKAVEKSINNGFSSGQHFNLAAQIANAWKWSVEQRRYEDKDGNENVIVRRFVAPVNIGGEDTFAWLTVKETEEGLRIYSVELLKEEKLRHQTKRESENRKAFYARSFDDILSRLSGPVKSESGETSLASLKIQDIFRLPFRKTVQIADAPEINHFFQKNDLSLLQRLLALPHWIAKKFPGFAKIYERQLRRVDERQAALVKSLEQVPSLFGRKRLNRKDMASLTKLIWEIEGKPLPFELVGKGDKCLTDGKLGNVKLLYQDKNKSLALARTNRLQLSQVRKLPARLDERNIVTDTDIVKPVKKER